MQSPWILVTILILSSLSLIVSLAWNDAVKATMDKYYPGNTDNMRSKIVYALVITGATVAIAYVVAMYVPDAVKKL
jgi:hypothetical protein